MARAGERDLSDFPMVIRSATVDDIPALLALEQRSPGAAHWTAEQYRKLFSVDQNDRGSLVLVAKAATSESNAPPSIDAFLVACCVAGEWELENLAVAVEHRGKGIGASLLTEFKNHALAKEGLALYLEVRESNQPARRLYEKFGFGQTGRRRRYYVDPVEDAVLYRLKLTP